MRIPPVHAVLSITLSLTISAAGAATDSPDEASPQQSQQAAKSGLESMSSISARLRVAGSDGASEMGRVIETVKAATIELQKQTATDDAALEAAGWARVLDPVRIRSDIECNDSRNLIGLARSTLDRKGANLSRSLEAQRRHIESSQLDAELKAEMLDLNHRSNARVIETFQRFLALERQSVAAISQALDALCNLDAWSLEGDTILFNSDSYLDKFNSSMDSLDSLNAQLSEVLKLMADRAESASNTLEDLADEAAAID